jgi:chromosome segregation and condensation protein ScpB
MRQRAAKPKDFDRELADLSPPLRWRKFMWRVEGVIFAALQPVKRETLVALIGSDCSLDRIIADIRDELRARPYDIVEVAGGYRHLTRPCCADDIRASSTAGATMPAAANPSPLEQQVLTTVLYLQPITRMGIAENLGRPISPDTIATLRRSGLIANGPRSPQPGVHTYVSTEKLLLLLGLSSLHDLPEIDLFEKAGPLDLPLVPLDGDGGIDASDSGPSISRQSNARRS